MKASLKYSVNVPRYLYIAISAVACLFLVSLINRTIHLDDAWLGEQAYWLAKKNYVKSELLRGLIGYEDRQHVYHKLFIWLGALIIKLFGFHLYALKSISLVFLGVFIITFNNYLKKHLLINDKVRLLLIFFLLINPLVFQYGFVYRPEIMLMTLGFITYICLAFSYNSQNKNFALVAGVFAGLSFLTHLNGLSIAVTGFLVLVLYKQFRLAAFYSFGVFCLSSFYLLDLNSAKEIELFIFQFKYDPALVDDDYSGVLNYIMNLLGEHKRFFRDIKTVFFSMMVFFLIIIGIKGLKEHSFLGSFTIILIIIFAMIAQSKTTKYMLVYLPFLLLMAGISLQYIKGKKNKAITYSTILFILLYCSISVFSNCQLISENKNSLAMHKEIALIYKLHGQQIVAPMQFIFEEIESVNIQSVTVYKFFKDQEELRNGGPFAFFRIAEQFGNESIIMTPESFEMLKIDIPRKGKIYGNYKFIDIVEREFYIFKLVD